MLCAKHTNDAERPSSVADSTAENAEIAETIRSSGDRARSVVGLHLPGEPIEKVRPSRLFSSALQNVRVTHFHEELFGRKKAQKARKKRKRVLPDLSFALLAPFCGYHNSFGFGCGFFSLRPLRSLRSILECRPESPVSRFVPLPARIVP